MATRRYFDRKKIAVLPDASHEFINNIGRMWEKHRLAKKFNVTVGYIEWVWNGCPEMVYKERELPNKGRKKDREAVAYMSRITHHKVNNRHESWDCNY